MSKSLTIIVQPVDSDEIHQAVIDAANRIAEVVGATDRPWDVDVVEGTFDNPMSGDNIHGLGRKPSVLEEIVGLIGIEVFAGRRPARHARGRGRAAHRRLDRRPRRSAADMNHCRNCDAPLPATQRWCGESCRRREDGPPEREDD